MIFFFTNNTLIKNSIQVPDVNVMCFITDVTYIKGNKHNDLFPLRSKYADSYISSMQNLEIFETFNKIVWISIRFWSRKHTAQASTN